MSAPANQQQPFVSSPIAGTVLPIRRAEELLATLPGVIAARIVASESGAVDEIHVLTTSEVTPKQTVRNVESALIAHLAMRVDHRKISVATTVETPKTREAREAAREAESAEGRSVAAAGTSQPIPASGPSVRPAPMGVGPPRPAPGAPQAAPEGVETVRVTQPATEPSRPASGAERSSAAPARAAAGAGLETDVSPAMSPTRHLLFENVEVRRSRGAEVSFRVTLSKGAESFVGESGGFESERSRIEHVARATVEAIKEAEGDDRHLVLEGCRAIDAFERQFAFVALTVREGREAALLTGSCEIKEGPETAAVLAVLDATNRWIARPD